MSVGPNQADLRCRGCRSDACTSVLDLGRTPIADRLVPPERLDEEDPVEELEVVLCGECGLAQLTRTVPPDVLFADGYPYYSSFSPALLQHARAHARELIETRNLGRDSFVVEIASNDGYLLRNFQEHGIRVLGIDPARGPVAAAREIGITTRETFFGRELARELAAEGERPQVVVANNVLAHVADLRGFVAGIAELLAPDGIASVEVPYVVDLVDHGELDTIYHQHLCYFSVAALTKLFAAEGLSLNRVTRQSIHGGSLRLQIGHRQAPDETVTTLLEAEAKRGVNSGAFYERLRHTSEELRSALPALLFDLKQRGHRIAGYGAAAKATTLMSVCSIDGALVDFIVDRNRHKHGMRMPGCRIPIAPVERLVESKSDFTMLFAWNFADEILDQQAEYVQRGGKFIVPIPRPAIRPES